PDPQALLVLYSRFPQGYPRYPRRDLDRLPKLDRAADATFRRCARRSTLHEPSAPLLPCPASLYRLPNTVRRAPLFAIGDEGASGPGAPRAADEVSSALRHCRDRWAVHDKPGRTDISPLG